MGPQTHKQRRIAAEEPLGTVSTLRKHAYSNTLRILPPKNENFR